MENVEPRSRNQSAESIGVKKRRPHSLIQFVAWWFTHLLCSLSCTLLWSLRTRGGHRIPPTGPVLVVANHQSFFDPIVIGVASPRPLGYLARKGLFANAFFSWVIRTLRAVPIDQEGVAKDGIRAVLSLLCDGQAVVVFPEGERTLHGDMNPLKPGIYLILKRAKVPVVPVGIAGAYQAWPRWQGAPKTAPLVLPPAPGTIAVSVGKPIDPNTLTEMSREQILTLLYDEIHRNYEIAEKLRRRK